MALENINIKTEMYMKVIGQTASGMVKENTPGKMAVPMKEQ